MTAVPAASNDFGLGAQLRLGRNLLLVLLAVVLGWGAVAQISGAVIAPGRVSVESAVKKIQHREGGIVSDVLVHEGDRVAAGQLLVRLDATVDKANATTASEQLDELTTRRMRLEAERDGRASVAAPADATPQFRAALAAELRLMASRQASREQKKAQLREQVNQTAREVDGLNAQVASQAAQFDLIQGEIKGIKTLYDKGLAPLSRLNELEREGKRLEGQKGELIAEIARSKTHASEIQLQMLQVDSDFLAEVMTDLKDTNLKLSQVEQQKTADDDALARVEIRAPVAGRVQQLAVHNRGGVVTPGETVMLVVPDGDRLIVEARIDPQKVEQVRQGGQVHIRFTGFSGRTTPEVVGRVDSVSPDAQTDEKTGASFYVARCSVRVPDLPPEIRSNLTPGMPAEVHVQTGAHSALSYFLRPLTDQMARAFKEG